MSHIQLAGTASGGVFQHSCVRAVLSGLDAGCHHEGGLGDAVYHGHNSGRVAQCCWQHLHWTGIKMRMLCVGTELIC